jgi:hypothetical protein
MKMFKILFLFISLLCFDQINALEFIYPNLFGDTWQSIVYEDDKRRFKAKFPGELIDNPSSDRMGFFHSFHRNVHYAIHMSTMTHPLPDTLEEFLHDFEDLEQAEIIVLDPEQPLIRYLLQIYFLQDGGSTLQSICRIFATENALYLALIEGHDFTLAEEFFQSIRIDK